MSEPSLRIGYKLLGLRERKAMVSVPTLAEGEKSFSADWQFEADFRMRTESLLEIIIYASATQRNQEEEGLLLHFELSHTFGLSKEHAIAEVLETKDASHKQFMFLATLTGICLGTVRGLIFARTVGVIGPSLFMPVVYPDKLLKYFLERDKGEDEEGTRSK